MAQLIDLRELRRLRRLFFKKRHACFPVVRVVRRPSLAIGLSRLLLFSTKVTRLQKPFSFEPLPAWVSIVPEAKLFTDQNGAGKVAAPEQRVPVPIPTDSHDGQ
jgi:hypothetical protein